MKRTWLVLFVIFVLSHGLFAATWSKWNNITVGTSAGNISKWNNGTIGTTTGNIGAWNGLTSPGGGGGTPVVTQINSGGTLCTGTSTTTLTCTATLSAGDLYVVNFRYLDAGGVDITGITDNGATGGNTWAKSIDRGSHSAFTGWSAQYWTLATKSATTVTATWPSNSQIAEIWVVQITNATTYNVGHYDPGSGTTAYTSGATATLHQSVEACVGFVWLNDNATTFTPTSYTEIGEGSDANNSLEVAYIITAATTAQTYAGTATTAGNSRTLVGCYY